LAAFSVSWTYIVGRTPWLGISPSQGLYLHIEQHKHWINVHNTDIHALGAIRTNDLSVRTREDTSCLRPRGHCDHHKSNMNSSGIEPASPRWEAGD
jgi:hypothetical protein